MQTPITPEFLDAVKDVTDRAHRALPHLERKVNEASRLVANGGVEPDGTHRYSVASTVTFMEKWYTVYNDHCNCADFYYNAHDPIPFSCKHILATWIYRRTMEQLAAPKEMPEELSMEDSPAAAHNERIDREDAQGGDGAAYTYVAGEDGGQGVVIDFDPASTPAVQDGEPFDLADVTWTSLTGTAGFPGLPEDETIQVVGPIEPVDFSATPDPMSVMIGIATKTVHAGQWVRIVQGGPERSIQVVQSTPGGIAPITPASAGQWKTILGTPSGEMEINIPLPHNTCTLPIDEDGGWCSDVYEVCPHLCESVDDVAKVAEEEFQDVQKERAHTAHTSTVPGISCTMAATIEVNGTPVAITLTGPDASQVLRVIHDLLGDSLM